MPKGARNHLTLLYTRTLWMRRQEAIRFVMKSLKSRITDLEDNFVERKEGIRGNDEIRKAVVSFANSLLEGQTAVLFIGISNGGAVTGVSEADAEKFQGKVRRICENDCYPPIVIRTVDVITVDNKHVLAFEFGPSKARPHFTGHAFVRVGSESVNASPALLDELIASRNTKAGQLLAAKDKHALVTVIIPDRALIPGQSQFSQRREWTCGVDSCDALTVRFLDHGAQRFWSLPLEFLVFGKDPNHDRLLVEYTRTR